MKYSFVAIMAIVIVCVLYIAKEGEKKQLALIRELVQDPKAEVKWSEGMNDGESRNYTVWRNGECSAVIGIRKDQSYYVNKSHCVGD